MSELPTSKSETEIMRNTSHVHCNDEGVVVVDTDSMLSISEASKIGLSAVLRRAEAGEDLTILRGSKVAAMVVSYDWYKQLVQRAGVVDAQGTFRHDA
jgi:hypothetical protein